MTNITPEKRKREAQSFVWTVASTNARELSNNWSTLVSKHLARIRARRIVGQAKHDVLSRYYDYIIGTPIKTFEPGNYFLELEYSTDTNIQSFAPEILIWLIGKDIWEILALANCDGAVGL